MGFSFAKLFLLLLVLAVVWFGWRYFRIREKEADIAAERMRQGGVAKAALKEDAETMAPCRVCKTQGNSRGDICSSGWMTSRADRPPRSAARLKSAVLRRPETSGKPVVRASWLLGTP